MLSYGLLREYLVGGGGSNVLYVAGTWLTGGFELGNLHDWISSSSTGVSYCRSIRLFLCLRRQNKKTQRTMASASTPRTTPKTIPRILLRSPGLSAVVGWGSDAVCVGSATRLEIGVDVAPLGSVVA